MREENENAPGVIPEQRDGLGEDAATAVHAATNQELPAQLKPARELSGSPPTQAPTASLPYLPSDRCRPILSQRNRVYVEWRGKGNPNALLVGSRQLNNLFRAYAKESNTSLKKWELEELNEQLTATAEMAGQITDVWYRVAPLPCGGFEIDLGDAAHTRVRVTAGNVEIVRTGSNVVFSRTPTMLPLPEPAEGGNVDLLRDKINLHETEYMLLLGWLTYTLAHPKTPSSKYVILVVHGDQGSGKSFLCARIIQGLLDPNQLGAQVFPHNVKDLSILAEHAHVLLFDNMRNFRATMSDVLCMMSTGGTLSNRALYSNADLYTHYVHGAVVMNGIHHLMTQADLSERCLTLHTQALPATERRSESEMIRELERDLPVIFRGLLDLTAKTLAELPGAEVRHPQRMLDFVHWLAAMEKALAHEAGELQREYESALNEAQRDSLLDNLLGSAVIEFAADLDDEWSGTPSQLLSKLNDQMPFGTSSSPDWPRNAIALSKRLNALKASLRTQGIVVEIRRGKERTIVLRKEGGDHG